MGISETLIGAIHSFIPHFFSWCDHLCFSFVTWGDQTRDPKEGFSNLILAFAPR